MKPFTLLASILSVFAFSNQSHAGEFELSNDHSYSNLIVCEALHQGSVLLIKDYVAHGGKFNFKCTLPTWADPMSPLQVALWQIQGDVFSSREAEDTMVANLDTLNSAGVKYNGEDLEPLIHFSSIKSFIKLFRRFEAQGFQVASVGKEYDSVPFLYLAVGNNGNEEIVRYLLAHEKNLNINFVDHSNGHHNALYEAIMKNKPELVKALAARKDLDLNGVSSGDANTNIGYDVTALTYAFQLFIENPNLDDGFEHEQRFQIMQILVNAGASRTKAGKAKISAASLRRANYPVYLISMYNNADSEKLKALLH